MYFIVSLLTILNQMKSLIKILLLLLFAFSFSFSAPYYVERDYSISKKNFNLIRDDGVKKGFLISLDSKFGYAYNYYVYSGTADEYSAFVSSVPFSKINQYVPDDYSSSFSYFFPISYESSRPGYSYAYSAHGYRNVFLCSTGSKFRDNAIPRLLSEGVPQNVIDAFSGSEKCEINCSKILPGSVFNYGKCVCPVGKFEEENTKQCLSCNLVNEDNYTLEVAEQCFCKGAGFKRDEISKIASAVLNCERFVTIGDKTLGVNYIFKDGKGYAGVTGFFCNGEIGPDFNFVVPAPEKCVPSTPQPDPEPAPDPNNPNPDKPDPNKPNPNNPNPDKPDPNKPNPNNPNPDKPDPNIPPVPKPIDDNNTKPGKSDDNNTKPGKTTNNFNIDFDDGRIVGAIDKTNELLEEEGENVEKIKDRLDDLLDSDDYKDFDKKDLDFDLTDGKNLLKQSSDALKNISDVMGNTIKDTKNQVGNIKKSIDNAISKLKDPLGGSISSYKTCNCLYSKPLNLGFKTISIQMDPCEFICKINNVTYLVFFIIFFYIFLKFTIFLLFKIF